MKKQTLLALLIAFSFNCYFQINYEKGYFIDNQDNRTECFIKNVDWKDNPKKFEYKISEQSTPETATIEAIKEFGVASLKYKRFQVKIDRSSEDVNKLSYDRNPEFTEETLFLKYLVEGKANLLQYEEGNLVRFYYNVDNAEVMPLTYKVYLTTGDNYIRKNEGYKQQLLVDLKCDKLTVNDAKNAAYKKNSLIKYFVKYNNCENSELVTFDEKKKRDLFNLNIRPGISFNSLTIDRENSLISNVELERKLIFRLGLEAEFILPFNKNKWTLFIEPTYHNYQSTKSDVPYTQTGSTISTTNVIVEYPSLELPFGVRHYFFLNEQSKLFINGAFVLDFPVSAVIKFEPSGISDVEISKRNNLAFGLGYVLKNKYSLEVRYGSNRNIISAYQNWSSKYNSFAFVFGYTLF